MVIGKQTAWWRLRCRLGLFLDYPCVPWVTSLWRERYYANVRDDDVYWSEPNPLGWRARVSWWESYSERWHPTRLGAVVGAARALVPFHLWGGYVFRRYHQPGLSTPWWYRVLRGDGEVMKREEGTC